MSLTDEAKRIWQNENFLLLEEVKSDFIKAEPLNLKVKEFKKLLERYKAKQIEFEKTGEKFSPYCIGYGNITSPVWFLGEAEGGKNSYESDRYNVTVKTSDVISDQHIIDYVFITPCELIRKFKIGKGDNGQGCDYINFIFASKIILTLLGQDITRMTDRELAEEAGNYQFFTEFWRYRAPPDDLEKLEKKVRNGSKKWDEEREKFLLDLDDTLKPKVIIAYPPINKTFDNGQNTQEKVKNLFENTNRLIDLTGEWNIDTLIDRLKDSINNRPVLLTRWPHPNFLTNEQIINIGNALKTIWTKKEKIRKEQKMSCFIGIVANRNVKKYCIENLCVMDAYESAFNKYRDVKKGDKCFIYDRANDNLLYGFKAKSGPSKLSSTPFRFRNFALDLYIPLELTESEIKEFDGARELLQKAGVTFYNENPEPRVYDDSVADNIEKTLKEVPPEEEQIKDKKDKYESESSIKLTDKELKMLLAAKQKFPLQESFISFEDIIGLNNIKQLINDLLKAVANESNCKKYYLQICRGFFLFGPPGTGKTIFTKAVAKELQAKYFEVSPSIISGFPGDAETLIELFLKERFEDFEKEKKGVIIFDEADALFPDRNKPYMSSVMARIVPTFLRVIDDLLKAESYRYCPIFLFAISNHPEAIDDAFLRPGRFAKLFYVGLPTDKEYEKLFELYLNSRKEVVDKSVLENLGQIVEITNERSKQVKDDYEKYQEKLSKDNKLDIHPDFGRFSPADIAEMINEAALKACLSNKSIDVDILKTVIGNTTPSVINEILNKNEEFKKTHPNTKTA